jgi:hypothetical protein
MRAPADAARQALTCAARDPETGAPRAGADGYAASVPVSVHAERALCAERDDLGRIGCLLDVFDGDGLVNVTAAEIALAVA